ncbi:Aldo keto reductase [Pluteus cervinus]|uniref:Aldo keto reductase n=1 Tax=Pluteus cervinus TaxID=181527 RepID=A0ACD3ARE6_9AGAR|nr:Aldo keto reductase [Pluteus cervinus]
MALCNTFDMRSTLQHIGSHGLGDMVKWFRSNFKLTSVPESPPLLINAGKSFQRTFLGASGVRVSVPILGAMGIGSSKWQSWVLDEEKGVELLKKAFDLGINTIDSANIYSNGESERIIESPCLLRRRDYVNQTGLSRAGIFNAVNASLERLDTPYIDILMIHRYDPQTPAEETMRALHDLVQSGKVRYLGASSMHTWQFAHLNHVAEKNGWTKFVVMEDEHSLLYREEEREVFGYCKYHDIGIIPYSPLSTGSLARPLGTDSLRSTLVKGTPFEVKLSEADKVIIARVEETATKKGWKRSQVALVWSQTKTVSPIVGVTQEDRLIESILGKDFVLTEEEIFIRFVF